MSGFKWTWQVPKIWVQKTLANLSLDSLLFVPDWPDFNTSSPFDVSSQQQGEDIYVQIKTHIKRYMNKEITYQNFIFNPRENPFLFSTYFCLVLTICKVQTNNSNGNAKNVTHVYKYNWTPGKLKIAPTVQTVYPIFSSLPHTISIDISLWRLSRKKIGKYFLSFPQKNLSPEKTETS